MTLIFPHIPKCSGTSILVALQNSGLSLFLDYDSPPSHLKYFSDQCDRRNAEFAKLDFSPFQIVYGHYPIQRYERREYRYACLLRDPVERAISQFNYFKYVLKNPVGLATNPLVHKVRQGMGIVEFAKEAQLDKFYWRYLNYKTDFAVVGFTDNIEAFRLQLSAVLGVNIKSLGRMRENSQKDHVTSREKNLLQDYLDTEIHYYDSMLQHHLAST